MSTVTPDPKPSTKRPSRSKAAIAERERLAAEQAALDAEPSNISPEDAEAGVVPTSTVSNDENDILNGDDEPAAQVDVKAKVRAASAATLARRAKNDADKTKTKERKAAERKQREDANAAWKAQVVADFESGKTIAEIAAGATNPRTNEPYSTMRVRTILKQAGKVEVVPRGETSERDARIVAQIEGGAELADIAKEHELSTQRVRGIARKAGLVVSSGERGKLPKSGTPEWDAFVADAQAFSDKWGAAFGTMAIRLRSAS